MKVGTDGVLLGAWAELGHAQNILDIGTGTGLISLMMAQRSEATITAIDINMDAAQQAQENVAHSKWATRIHIKACSLSEFVEKNDEKYDVIVCNPPFFNQSLHAPCEARNAARHATQNFHNDLVILSKKLLHTHGKMYLILPVNEGNTLLNFAEQNGFFCTKKVSVFPKPNTHAKRLLIELSCIENTCATSSITIETELRHEYHPDFIALVKDFYLKL